MQEMINIIAEQLRNEFPAWPENKYSEAATRLYKIMLFQQPLEGLEKTKNILSIIIKQIESF